MWMGESTSGCVCTKVWVQTLASLDWNVRTILHTNWSKLIQESIRQLMSCLTYNS